MTPAGFPHSDIPGSKTVCVSPRLIAAYHVLHRLLVPRHPPCTLSSLTGYSLRCFNCVYPASHIRLSMSVATNERRVRRAAEPQLAPKRYDGPGRSIVSRIWWR